MSAWQDSIQFWSPTYKLSAGAQENTFWLDARPGNFLSVKRALFFLGEVQVSPLR